MQGTDTVFFNAYQITLSKELAAALEKAARTYDNKDDGKFIRDLLLALYTKEQLKNISVTGSASKNPSIRKDRKEAISKLNLEFIYGKLTIYYFYFLKLFFLTWFFVLKQKWWQESIAPTILPITKQCENRIPASEPS